MKPRKVHNKDGSPRWVIDYYDPAGKRVKRRFKKQADAERFTWRKLKVEKDGLSIRLNMKYSGKTFASRAFKVALPSPMSKETLTEIYERVLTALAAELASMTFNSTTADILAHLDWSNPATRHEGKEE